MGIGSIAGLLAGGFGLGMMIPPAQRTIGQELNRAMPNELLGVGEATELLRRNWITTEQYHEELDKQGYDTNHKNWLYWLKSKLNGITELITLYRRGELTIEGLKLRAFAVGWDADDVDKWLRITEVIPSAQDIIRYAVREVYTPEIAEAFGQFDELPKVLEQAELDLKAAGLPVDTFTKEWAAHWLLPSIMQGYEMLHRGVIPALSSEASPVSLERLMVALDIMPAWRDKLTQISYSPYTRVDVRRMHKIGVLDDEAVFTAYADVGFSPFAPGDVHETVADAFRCETCRHESKAGRMLDFTLLYNTDPPEEEKTEKDKERDLTKADILNGLRDELITESEGIAALQLLGYDEAEIAYYRSRVDYERDKDELSNMLKYLHDAYVRSVITYEETTDELGRLNLPAKMTEYYLAVWDMERRARTNKPTKSELMAFLRKEIIDQEIWHTEMLGLGYSERYIEWYAETV